MERARHLLLYHYLPLLLRNRINALVPRPTRAYVANWNCLVQHNVAFTMGHVKEMISSVTLNVYARLTTWDRVVNEVASRI